MTAQFAIDVASSGAMLGLAISSAEYLWLDGRGAFGFGGIWPGPLMQTDYYPIESNLPRLFRSPSTLRFLFWTRIIAAFAGVLSIILALSPLVPLLVLILLNGILHYRVRWGGEGGDQMTSLILLSSAAAYLAPKGSPIALASCCFLGAQLTLSYFGAGVAKLYGQLWRSGDAFTKVLSNYTYGNRALASFVIRHSRLSALMNYTVIGFELTFPLCFLLGDGYCYGYLAMGALFHLGIAVVMRLHLFLYTFIAVYPCFIVTREVLRAWL
jgi:hypothetical protein